MTQFERLNSYFQAVFHMLAAATKLTEKLKYDKMGMSASTHSNVLMSFNRLQLQQQQGLNGSLDC